MTHTQSFLLRCHWFLMIFIVTGCATLPEPPRSLRTSVIDGPFFSESNVENVTRQLKKSAFDGDMFTLAVVYDKTGHPEKAFQAYIDSIEAARQSTSFYWEGMGAAIGLVGIRRRVKSFESRLQPHISRWSDSPGKLAPEALYQLRTLAFSFAMKKGDSENATHLLRTTGCITHWALTEPIGSDARGKKTQSQLTRMHVWPQTVDAGAGRPPSAVSHTTFEVCQISPQSSSSIAAGTLLGQSAIHLEKSSRIWLRLQSTADTHVFINEKEIYAQESQSHWLPESRWLSIWLPAGNHQVTVSVYSPEFTPSFSLSALTDTQHQLPSGATSLPATDFFHPKAAHPVQMPKAQSESATLAKMNYLTWNVDPYGWQPLKKLLRNDFPLHYMLRAEYELMSPFNAMETGMENARQFYESALEAAPSLFEAAIYLARHAQRHSRNEQALDILTSAIAAMPHEPLLHITLAEIAYEKKWIQTARAALEHAAAIVGDSCEVAQWRYAIALSEKDYESTLTLSKRVSQCAASSSVLATELTRTGDFDGAVNALEKIADHQPNSMSARINVALAMMRAGKHSKGIGQLEETLARFPHAVEPAMHLIDAYVATGEPDRATALCARQAVLPTRPELYRICELVEGQSTMAPFRIDGLEVVRQYVESKAQTNTDFSWVLDRMVYMVDDFGSGVQLVHWIGHVNSIDAVDQYGEMDIPHGALVLQARVIKPSLETIYPTMVDHKSSLSLPNLGVGDFVELETVSPIGLHPFFSGGFDTAPFYFRDFNSTFVRSELIVVAPDHFTLQYDSRGNAPAPIEQVDNGTQIVAFRTRNQTPLRSEPGTPAPREFLPSVRVTANGSRQSLCDGMNEQMRTTSQSTPAIDRFLQTKIGRQNQKKSNRRQIEIVYEWINQNIDDDPMLFEPVSHVLSRKRGSRARLFQQMLSQMDIQTELGLAMTAFDDHTPNAIADPDHYTVPVVRLQDGTWVSFQDKHAQLGALPSELRQQPVLMLNQCTLTKTTAGRTPVEQSDVDASLVVNENGSATGIVTQSIEGDTAAILRALFENSESEQRRIVEEHLLATLFPEAEMRQFSIENLKENSLPLKITFEVFILKFARDAKNAHELFLPMPIHFTQYTNGMAARSLPLVLATYFEKRHTISITLPRAVPMAQLPDNQCAQSENIAARYCTTFSGNGNQLEIALNATMNIDRIPANHYTEFQDFVLTTEQMNSTSIDIR